MNNDAHDLPNLRKSSFTRSTSFLFRFGAAAVTAAVFTPVQFVVFPCSEVLRLSVGSGIVAFGSAGFGVACLAARDWWLALGAFLLTAMSLPLMVLSHMCS
jgi:hypothetical protein